MVNAASCRAVGLKMTDAVIGVNELSEVSRSDFVEVKLCFCADEASQSRCDDLNLKDWKHTFICHFEASCTDCQEGRRRTSVTLFCFPVRFLL